MKKLLTLTLAALMLLTFLTSCRMPERTDPFKEILEENPDLELPKSEVMEVDPDTIPKYEIEDSVKDYDDEQVIEIPADGDLPGGELVVKYKICNYGDNNLALVSVENHSEQALSISIDGVCENTLEERSKTINREFEGFAANWQNYFVFYPTMEFDEFSYEINFEPYDGETYGQYVTNLDWEGVWLGQFGDIRKGMRTALMMWWFFDYMGKDSTYYGCDYVLFDMNGDVLTYGTSTNELTAYNDVLHYHQLACDSMGPTDHSNPLSWKRNPIYHVFHVDNESYWKDVMIDPTGEYAQCAQHPISETNYKLPDEFSNVYGILSFTAFYGGNFPTEFLPSKQRK